MKLALVTLSISTTGGPFFKVQSTNISCMAQPLEPSRKLFNSRSLPVYAEFVAPR